MRHRRPASCRRWAPFVVAMVFASSAAYAQKETINLRAEVGAEYDSNVHRAETVALTRGRPVVASPLGRLVLAWSAADRVGASQDVSFSLLGATKMFTNQAARGENIAVVETSGTWRGAVGERTWIGAGAHYYEAIQAGTRTEQELSTDARDFRSLVPMVRLIRGLGESGMVTLAAGYRFFVYKPVRSYDFGAPVLSAQYRLTRETADGTADWDVMLGGGVELRRFQGNRLVNEPAGCTPAAGAAQESPGCATVADPGGVRHRDQFFSGYLDVTRTGRVLAGAGYALQWNRSNSFSETLLRHVGTLRFAAPLPLGLYLAVRAELVFVSYADRVPLVVGPTGQASSTIDEENRNQARAEISRDLGKSLQVVGRYSYYANALGQVRYHRQTATLSLAFTID